jgi:asparaginyl-tRNA synthetase
MHHYISDFTKHIGHEVTVKGWVINIRTSKTNCFFDFRAGTGFTQCVVSLENVGEEAFEAAKSLTLESSVAFSGILIRNEKNLGGYEIQVNKLHIYHLSEGYPITKEDKEMGVDFLSDKRHLWLRSRRQWAIMRVRNELIMSIHDFFQNEGFVQMDAPILTGNACEGTTDLFATEFFGRDAYLSQSGQLYGEAMAMAMNKIYTFGPTFRAEKSNTPRHLSEFWMIEPEMAFYTNEDNMNLIERFIQHVIGRVLFRCRTELETLERDVTGLQKAATRNFPRIQYVDAIKILRGEMDYNGKNCIQAQKDDLAAIETRLQEIEADIKARQEAMPTLSKGQVKFYEAKILALQSEQRDLEEKARNIPKWIESALNFEDGNDFGNSDETVLTRIFDTPIMVFNWPTKIKSFYMKEVEGNPDYVKGVDLLAPDGFGEVVGGSERETDINVLLRKIDEHGLDRNVFEWYLDLRRFGSVPHAGFGLGLERLVRWCCNLPHVRETIPFQRRYGRIEP